MSISQRMLGESGTILSDAQFRVLLLVSFTLAWGTPLVSPILDSLTGPFGVSAARIGLFISLFSAPAIVMIPITGALADRIGRKPILVVGLAVFGIAGLGIATTTTFEAALVFRLFQGLGWSGVQVTTITGIGDLYSGDEEATAQGLRVAMLGTSSTVMPVLAGALVGFDWRYPFLLYALAIPIAVLALARFREPASIHAGESDEQVLTGSTSDQIRTLVRFALQRRVVTLLFARTTPGIVYIGFLTYSSLLIGRTLGGTPEQAGIVVAVFSIVFAGSATQAGRLTAAAGGRVPVLLLASASMAVGMTIVAFSPAVMLAAAGSIVLALGFGLLQSVYRSAVTDIAPAELRGGLVSFSESLARVAMTAVPVVMGGVIARMEPVVGGPAAIRWALFLAGAVAGGGGIVLMLVSRASPAPQLPS